MPNARADWHPTVAPVALAGLVHHIALPDMLTHAYMAVVGGAFLPYTVQLLLLIAPSQCLSGHALFESAKRFTPDCTNAALWFLTHCYAVDLLHLVQMSPMLSGRIDIQYRRVECTPPSHLQINIDQNAGSGGFLKMSVTVSRSVL